MNLFPLWMFISAMWIASGAYGAVIRDNSNGWLLLAAGTVLFITSALIQDGGAE